LHQLALALLRVCELWEPLFALMKLKLDELVKILLPDKPSWAL
jgi:hypothetical protein